MTIQKMRVSPYGVNDELLSVEVNLLNDQMPAFVDGEDGGLYEPTTPIAIGGNGLTCTTFFSTSAACSTLLDGTVVFPNGFSCTGTSTTTFGDNSVSIGSGGELTAYCDSFFNGDVTCTAASNVALSAGAGVFTCGKTASFGSTVAISGAVTCGSTLAVAGVATFAAKPVFSDGLTVGAGTHTVDFNNSTTNIGGTLNLSAIVRLISSARIQYRYVAGVNANHTYTIADCDMIVVPPSGSTTTRIYTISNTGCSGGEVIEIFNGNFPTQRFSIVQHDGGTAIADLDGTLDFIGVKIVNDGSGNATSAWKVVSATSAP